MLKNFLRKAGERDRLFWRESKLKGLWLSFMSLWLVLYALCCIPFFTPFIEDYAEALCFEGILLLSISLSFFAADYIWTRKANREAFRKIERGET